MSKIAVFVHVQDKPGIIEAELAALASAEEILATLKEAGVDIDDEILIFIDEVEDPLKHDHKGPIEHLKPGSRIHVARCRKVAVTVHYQHRTIERSFPPGARVRTVKHWAVHELKINPTDAGEHVLQLCNSTKQPPTDTPLAELTDGKKCAVCFDFVPEKRIEG
jgi:hypothetical protein